jgi:CRP-like cAMP-binding protein
MTASEISAFDIPRSTELLRGLERQEIDLILAAAKLRRFRASSVITHQGDPSDQTVFAVEGAGALFR